MGRITDFRQLVNVCASIAKRKEGTSEDISIEEIVFCPVSRVYVALYRIPASSHRRMTSLAFGEGKKVRSERTA